MDNQMLSVIADTLKHIDTALSIIVFFLIITAAIGVVRFFLWLYLGGGDE